MTPRELLARFETLPRVRLAHLPTPIEELKRLTAELGGPRILVKREDATGLAIGGNKTRQFEIAVGDAVAQGADTIVTGAASQSNHCRQAAAAAARMGLGCSLVLRKDARRDPVQGNHLLMRLLGADIRFVDAQLGPEILAEVKNLEAELRGQGRNPYVIVDDRGNGACGVAYTGMVAELQEQLGDVRPTHVYVCSSGPTGGGLQLGAALLGVPWKPVYIAPVIWPTPAGERMARIANTAAEMLGVERRLSPEDFDLRRDYVGEGYGIPTKEGVEAIRLVARTEGLLLDPVYTGKAMAGLIDHVRRGELTRDHTVVFIHTGGTPALFAYAPELI